MAFATDKQTGKQPRPAASNWRRVAVKPITGKKLDILLSLANVSRAANDKLFIYDLAEELVDKAWQDAKARGLVSDAMMGLDDAIVESSAPVYTRVEEAA